MPSRSWFSPGFWRAMVGVQSGGLPGTVGGSTQDDGSFACVACSTRALRRVGDMSGDKGINAAGSRGVGAGGAGRHRGARMLCARQLLVVLRPDVEDGSTPRRV